MGRKAAHQHHHYSLAKTILIGNNALFSLLLTVHFRIPERTQKNCDGDGDNNSTKPNNNNNPDFLSLNHHKTKNKK